MSLYHYSTYLFVAWCNEQIKLWYVSKFRRSGTLIYFLFEQKENKLIKTKLQHNTRSSHLSVSDWL